MLQKLKAAIALLSLLFAIATANAETQVQVFDTSWTVSPWDYYGEVAALSWSYTPYTVWNSTLGTLDKVEIRTVVSGSRSEPSETLTFAYAFATGDYLATDYQFDSGVTFGSGSATVSWEESRSFTGDALVDWLTYDYLPAGETQGLYYVETRALTSTYRIVAQTTLTYEYTPVSVPFTIDVANGVKTQGQAGWTLLSGTQSLTKTGLGTLLLDVANTLSSSIYLNEGTLQVSASQALGTATLNVASGAAFAIAPEMGALNAVRIERLGTIAGTLDVGVGRFTLGSYSGTVETAKSLLVSGRNGGGWDGSAGITSTAAAADLQAGIVRSVGWKENPDGSVTFAYAAPGDTDLSGDVNVFDLVNVNGSGSYGKGTPSVWSQGDFDYNGVTNIFDMVLTNGAGVYGRGNYLPAAPASASVNAVPEPSAYVVSLAGLACGSYLARRRRKRA